MNKWNAIGYIVCMMGGLVWSACCLRVTQTLWDLEPMTLEYFFTIALNVATGAMAIMHFRWAMAFNRGIQP